MKNLNWEKVTIKELAGIISTALRNSGVDAVLVGGACVSIYSDNKYVSGDLDYVTYESAKTVKPILEKIGFMQEAANRFVHPRCDFFIKWFLRLLE